MSESGCYSFRDLGSRIKVQLQVAPALANSDVYVDVTADSLRATDRNSSAVLLSVTQLYSTVEAGSLEHEVAEGQLTMTLQKLDQSLSWPTLEAPNMPHADETQETEAGDQTSRAMQEREKVKALLTAAQSGSMADLQKAAAAFGQDSLAEVKDGTGKNCLHFAAQLGNSDVCHYLLTELGFDPNEQEEAGKHPFCLQCIQRHIQCYTCGL